MSACGPRPVVDDYRRKNGKIRWKAYNRAYRRWLKCQTKTANTMARQEGRTERAEITGETNIQSMLRVGLSALEIAATIGVQAWNAYATANGLPALSEQEVQDFQNEKGIKGGDGDMTPLFLLAAIGAAVALSQ